MLWVWRTVFFLVICLVVSIKQAFGSGYNTCRNLGYDGYTYFLNCGYRMSAIFCMCIVYCVQLILSRITTGI